MNETSLRNLPSVDRVIQDSVLAEAITEQGHEPVVAAIREVLTALRARIVAGEQPAENELIAEGVAVAAMALVESGRRPSLRHAINAAGVVLHTGLGRAMLPAEAARQVADVMAGYCTLATDIETGRRGSRDVHVKDLICQLTGAEAATVVNNNAAATMLILNTMAQGKEVIVSRGQLVEIGGSFRMPDVMTASGAIMREVGTTNKTHLRDYREAIGDNTGAILRVHQSNYRIVGFSEEPSIQDLAALGREYGVPVIDDLGSGALIDLREFGLTYEPLVQESLEAGAAVACFSGDKLIGGPQCGIIVGQLETVSRIKQNPLARALRVGKLTLAALEATLRLFRNREALATRHPTYRMFSYSLEALQQRAEAVAQRMEEGGLPEGTTVTVEAGETQVGSGSVPTETIPTRVLSVSSQHTTAEDLARKLRQGEPPIFTRVHHEAVLLDLRTIQPKEDRVVAEAMLGLLRSHPMQ